MTNFRMKLGILIMSIGMSIMPTEWQNETAIRNLILIESIDHRFNWFRIFVEAVIFIFVLTIWFFALFN